MCRFPHDFLLNGINPHKEYKNPEVYPSAVSNRRTQACGEMSLPLRLPTFQQRNKQLRSRLYKIQQSDESKFANNTEI